MADISRINLFGKLNSIGYKAIEAATVFCKMRGNPYVEMAHWLHQILQLQDSDLHRIIHHYQLDPARLASDLTDALDSLPRGANSVSDLSSKVEEAVERGWVYATLLYGETQVRTGFLIVGMLKANALAARLCDISAEFAKIDAGSLTDDFAAIVESSPENGMIAKDGFCLTGTSATGSSDRITRPKDIFVCYRREDSQDITERICDRLFGVIGKDRVFKDIDAIPLGIRDFGEEIRNCLTNVRFFLPVIGPGWMDATNQHGQNRLEEENDFVRMEIELALATDAQIIPLMVGGAEMPASDRLPQSLRPLARRPTLAIRGGHDFRNDTQRLIDHINAVPAADAN